MTFGSSVQTLTVGLGEADNLAAAPHLPFFRYLQKSPSRRHRSAWGAAAKVIGLSKADGDRLNSAADNHYATCCDSLDRISQAVAAQLLARLLDVLQPAIDRFHQNKRAAALLDFDDLIFAARDLLRDHEPVRQALAARYRHVLVDEFQDTDPRQTEIFWRLCGDAAPGAATPTGRAGISGRARSFWSVIPSKRFIAFAARTSPLISKLAT